LKALAFTKPGSMTYRIPGIVRDVSAILVANITCKEQDHFDKYFAIKDRTCLSSQAFRIIVRHTFRVPSGAA
jgi:hypothetical protein